MTEPAAPRPAIALFQPDIPGNTGALMRLAACLDSEIHVIEPAGFRMDDVALRRAGMDYIERASLVRHIDWETFRERQRLDRRRLILFTTRAESSCYNFRFEPSDMLLFGSETAGAPQYVHSSADARVRIPVSGDTRSLNVAMAAAMALGEAIRQLARSDSICN